ncbi:c-type cytochrome [Edaphobacter paludis]|uniref:C-type cytochrome n=1 Tax=Edaphobacter paludis TaxID=3035702 RepID=A0AAU7CZ62_9BACT
MDQKFKLVFGAMCALFCGLCISNAAFGQNLPDGKGKAEFIHNCTACHRADMVTNARKTQAEWRKSVDDMAARGADGTKQDIDNVYLYLSTNFALDKAAPATAAPSTIPPSTLGAAAALNSSEIEQAKSLITQNDCLACHRIQEQGGYTGPALNSVGARHTPDEIRAAIVSPKPTLDPSNDLVRLTTADGKTLTGRILSQDDHNVQVIDTSGKVTTYSKPELSQFTIIDTNPMPSYEGRITGDDLNDLVRYLGSLPSVDGSVQK